MSEEKKSSAKEAALAVLKKVEEMLKKSEILTKYETENSKKLGYQLPPIKQKEAEKSDKAFEVEGKNSKSSNDPRLGHQVSPAKNPKEKAEGNNPKWGSEPKEGNEMKKDGEPQGQTLGAAIGYPGAASTAPIGKEEEEKAFIPVRSIGSAKLSKFVEHMHAKRKARKAPENG